LLAAAFVCLLVSAVLAQPAPQSGTEQRARKLANGKFVTTLTLTAETCKWPIGDPTEADFHYCG